MNHPSIELRHTVAILVAITLGILTQTGSAQTIHVKVRGKTIIGKPVVWNDHTVKVMERDGAVSEFSPSSASDYKLLDKSFRLYSRPELYNLLKREFEGYEVSATNQYLIVHPRGQKQLWTTRFEQIYRSVLHYFSVRKLDARPSPLPFVAIVFRNEAEYLKYLAEKEGRQVSGSLGVFLHDTNRIYLFDATNTHADGSEGYEDWLVNASTVIHESAHQTAFNTRVQRRFGAAPAWVSEGIGTLFEAKGVWNVFKYRLEKHRVNEHRLDQFRRTVNDGNFEDTVRNLISSDRIVMRSPDRGYGTAWAMTFFATERRSAQYARYLKTMYKREPFNIYTVQQRIADFERSFGDTELFVRDMRNFYRDL
ncbi:DUF1570 domain-containing protein [Planctomycetota bacterium]